MLLITKIFKKLAISAICFLLLGATTMAATPYGGGNYNDNFYEGVGEQNQNPGGGNNNGGSTNGGISSGGSGYLSSGGSSSGDSLDQDQVDKDEPSEETDDGQPTTPFTPGGSSGPISPTKSLGFMDRWGKSLLAFGSAILIFIAVVVVIILISRRRKQGAPPNRY